MDSKSLSGWIKYATFGLKTSASFRNASKFTPRSLTSVANFQSFHAGPLRMLGWERHTRGPFTSSLSATYTWPPRLHHYIAPSLLLTTAGYILDKRLWENNLPELTSVHDFFRCLPDKEQMLFQIKQNNKEKWGKLEALDESCTWVIKGFSKSVEWMHSSWEQIRMLPCYTVCKK